jgi:hypothetical protein
LLRVYRGCHKYLYKKTDYREKLTRNIDYEIENEQFISRSKDGSERVFTRKRKLPLKTIILLVIRFKSSIQRELDRFYKEVTKSDFNIREVTKGAFTQAIRSQTVRDSAKHEL